MIFYQFVGALLFVAFFNAFGVMITKYASAAQRATIDSCRTLTIWMVFISLGKEKFMMGELVGFVLLATGTLIYNEIVEVPIDAFRRNTKRNLAIKAKEEFLKKEALTAKQASFDESASKLPTQPSLLNEDEKPLLTNA